MFLWGNVTPVLAQHVNCCMQLIDVKGNWFGALRTCDLSKAPPESSKKDSSGTMKDGRGRSGGCRRRRLTADGMEPN